MESQQILTLLEQLDDEIDDLEEALSPAVRTTLVETASKLPLLDKAKLYVLVTYAIESILFSYLRLHGVKAREHPVFRELTRVKQYFDKIKLAETPVAEKTLTLDKKAAGRFIQAGLSGNDKYDLARAEQQAREKAKAQIKLQAMSKKRKSDSLEGTEKEEAVSEPSDDSSDSSSSEEKSVPPPKKKKSSKAPKAVAESPVPTKKVSHASKKKGKSGKKSKQ